MVDTIPLHEIMNIEEMLEDPESKEGTKDAERDIKKKGHKHNIIQLKTVPEGFNNGKVYYLKAVNVDEASRTIVLHLMSSARSARDRVERKSRFQKSKEAVRSVQSSFAFQSLVALLIMLVRKHPHSRAGFPERCQARKRGESAPSVCEPARHFNAADPIIRRRCLTTATITVPAAIIAPGPYPAPGPSESRPGAPCSCALARAALSRGHSRYGARAPARAARFIASAAAPSCFHICFLF